MMTRKALFFLIFFSTCSWGASAQSNQRFWVDLGLGTGSETLQSCVGLVYNYGPVYGKAQMQETQSFKTGGHYTSSAYGILIGKFRLEPERSLYFGAGISKITFLSENLTSSERKVTQAIGIPLEVCWIFSHNDNIGIGLRLNANINSRIPYIGAGVTIPIGKIY